MDKVLGEVARKISNLLKIPHHQKDERRETAKRIKKWAVEDMGRLGATCITINYLKKNNPEHTVSIDLLEQMLLDSVASGFDEKKTMDFAHLISRGINYREVTGFLLKIDWRKGPNHLRLVPNICKYIVTKRSSSETQSVLLYLLFVIFIELPRPPIPERDIWLEKYFAKCEECPEYLTNFKDVLSLVGFGSQVVAIKASSFGEREAESNKNSLNEEAEKRSIYLKVPDRYYNSIINRVVEEEAEKARRAGRILARIESAKDHLVLKSLFLWDEIKSKQKRAIEEGGKDYTNISFFPLNNAGVKRFSFHCEGYRFPCVGVRIYVDNYDIPFVSEASIDNEGRAIFEPGLILSNILLNTLSIIIIHAYHQIVVGRCGEDRLSLTRSYQNATEGEMRHIWCPPCIRRLPPGHKPHWDVKGDPRKKLVDEGRLRRPNDDCKNGPLETIVINYEYDRTDRRENAPETDSPTVPPTYRGSRLNYTEKDFFSLLDIKLPETQKAPWEG